MPSIILKECPKVYILETHRSKTPDSTLQFIQSIKELVSMIDFREASDLDRIGIPVFICHRTRPDNSRTSHTGKGVSEIQAQVSLTMESIERYSSEFRDEYKSKLVSGSYNQLKRKFNILDPHEMILSKISDYDHDREIHWVWGSDLARDEDIMVPACAVYHPYHLDNAFLMDTHTNGIAAGNTMEEAVVHGLAELIERDAWSIARYEGDYSDALFIEDEPANQSIINIFDKFEQEGNDDPRFFAYDRKGLQDIEASYGKDILLDVKTIISKLQARGLYRVIAVDLTRTDTGIPTVRMIVPGLETYCFDKMRIGARILKG